MLLGLCRMQGWGSTGDFDVADFDALAIRLIQFDCGWKVGTLVLGGATPPATGTHTHNTPHHTSSGGISGGSRGGYRGHLDWQLPWLTHIPAEPQNPMQVKLHAAKPHRATRARHASEDGKADAHCTAWFAKVVKQSQTKQPGNLRLVRLTLPR